VFAFLFLSSNIMLSPSNISAKEGAARPLPFFFSPPRTQVKWVFSFQSTSAGQPFSPSLFFPANLAGLGPSPGVFERGAEPPSPFFSGRNAHALNLRFGTTFSLPPFTNDFPPFLFFSPFPAASSPSFRRRYRKPPFLSAHRISPFLDLSDFLIRR